ncbi:hypothetical protein [Plantactinospora sp. KBS50]|uniref:hypothetical protein n=1 Tax=Plantactinospora sp. KBS50 TaxID=2024580 RepID=UPI000BAAFF59|nr:hypothetical protein [Plantactinospora sp. KBS50]ASW55503.1 hypothetical protein CIK06_16960 [Plantactinospora sp. KBS50]
MLLLLNAARDRAPITHGTIPDADAVVAAAADTLAPDERGLTAAEAAALPRDVATLLRAAVTAATDLRPGGPGRGNKLLALHRRIGAKIDAAITLRPTR